MPATLEKERIRETIARRVARELHHGDFVNLGIGLPTLIPQYLPDGVEVLIEAENGIVGAAPLTGEPDLDVVDAGGRPAACAPGGAFIDSATSFCLIRGGHMDATVLGALEVDQEGNIANWIIPGKMLPGMGGAMDLVVGARRVIVAMEHTQKGRAKILRRCTLPLTALACVDLIVTELGVFEVRRGGPLLLTEINPGVTVEEVLAATEAQVEVAPELAAMT